MFETIDKPFEYLRIGIGGLNSNDRTCDVVSLHDVDIDTSLPPPRAVQVTVHGDGDGGDVFSRWYAVIESANSQLWNASVI